MASYFYKIGEKVFGPVEGKQLWERIKTGVLIPDLTWVRREDKERWIRADKLKLSGSGQSSIAKAWKPLEERIEVRDHNGVETEPAIELEDPPVVAPPLRPRRPSPPPPIPEITDVLPSRPRPALSGLSLPPKALILTARIVSLGASALAVAGGVIYILVLLLVSRETIVDWLKHDTKGFSESIPVPPSVFLDVDIEEEREDQGTPQERKRKALDETVANYRWRLIRQTFHTIGATLACALVLLLVAESMNTLLNIEEAQRRQAAAD